MGNDTLTMPPTLDQSQPGQEPQPAPQEERRKKVDKLDPLGAAVVLLHGILKAINSLRRGNEFFQLNIVCNPGVGSTGAVGSALINSAARQGGTGASGVVKFVHNPTNAPVTLTLFDGDNRLGLPMFNAQLAPGESRPVWCPFVSDILASSGNSCQITGYYRP